MIETIDELIKNKPFSLGSEEKNKHFMKSISESIKFHYENCPEYQKYCKKKNFEPKNILNISDVPFLPVDIFKKMTLLSVPKSKIIKTIKSSATTNNIPSTIHLDKKTATRQIIALNSIMKDFIGEEKLDFTYIEDLINGISLCCKNKNAINQTFNLTYGKARAIGEMAEILKDYFDGIKISYCYGGIFVVYRIIS